MKIAIIHYWLVTMRGGEKVLESLCELFPEADIYTHVYQPENISPVIRKHRIRTTVIHKIPFIENWYHKALPLMPLALEQLDLSEYDLIISSESGPAKGVIVSPDSIHICYCHTPMRYLWDMYHLYRNQAGWLTATLIPFLTHYLRLWDVSSAARVDYFIANSEYVKKRIEKCYRRTSEIIHPPVDIEKFSISNEPPEDFYLVAGQLVCYKRVDVAVQAFNLMKKKLIVIGGGPEKENLKKLAGPTVQILGYQTAENMRSYYSRCRALIFPGIEDFGIVPVEVMASGRPVLAMRAGGAMETVKEGVTGLFFDKQEPESIMNAVKEYEACCADFSPDKIRHHAQKFERDIFQKKIMQLIDSVVQRS